MQLRYREFLHGGMIAALLDTAEFAAATIDSHFAVSCLLPSSRGADAACLKMRSDATKIPAKSTKPRGHPVARVWLQVRVLPGPPVTSTAYSVLFCRSGTTAPDSCAFRSRCSCMAIVSMASERQSGR